MGVPATHSEKLSHPSLLALCCWLAAETAAMAFFLLGLASVPRQVTCYLDDVIRGGLTQATSIIADESEYPTCGLSVEDGGTIRLGAIASGLPT